MKHFVIFLVLFPIFIFAEIHEDSKESLPPSVALTIPDRQLSLEETVDEKNISSFLAPLIPLSSQYPVNLSLENRQEFLENNEKLLKEYQNNEKILESRSFPWFLTVFAWILFVIIALWKDIRIEFDRWWTPSRTEAPLITAQKNLQELLNSPLYSSDHSQEFMLTLTDIQTHYLESTYHVQLAPYTVKEIKSQLNQIPSFTEDQKNKILQFYDEADSIKFSGQQASKEAMDKTLELFISTLQ